MEPSTTHNQPRNYPPPLDTPPRARCIQDTTEISIKRVIRALKPLQDVAINLNGHHLEPVP